MKASGEGPKVFLLLFFQKKKTLLFLKKTTQKDFYFLAALPAAIAAGLIFCVQPGIAQEQQTDPARLKAAMDIAAAMGGPDRMKQVFAAMRPAMINVFVAQQHMSTNRAGQIFDTELLPGLQAHAGDLVTARAKILAGIFTVSELNVLRNFYLSPLGQKLMANEATIATGMIKAMQPLMRDMVQRGAEFAKTHPEPEGKTP